MEEILINEIITLRDSVLALFDYNSGIPYRRNYIAIAGIVGLIVSILWYRLPFNKSIRKQYSGMKDAENEVEKKKQKRKYVFLVLCRFLILYIINWTVSLLLLLSTEVNTTLLPTTVGIPIFVSGYVIFLILFLVVSFLVDIFLCDISFAVACINMAKRSFILVLPIVTEVAGFIHFAVLMTYH